MIEPYNSLLLKQPNTMIPFHGYYLKKKKQVERTEPIQALHNLIQPRLKIALVAETWLPERNGVTHSLLELCKGLQKLGHQILLIRPEQKTVYTDFQPDQELLIKVQRLPQYQGLQFGCSQYSALQHAIVRFQPDVIHIVTEGPLGFIAQQIARAHRIAVSSGFHSPFQDFSRFFDLAFLLKPVQHYLKWFHNQSNLTIVPSRAAAQALRNLGVHCPLSIVSRGVDTAQFSPSHRSNELRSRWGVSDQTRVLLYVGRLCSEKHVDVIMQAYFSLRDLCDQDVRLVIVGDGPDKERLERLNYDNSVIFTGTLGGKNLLEAYASSDVFCCASQVESFGNVILEAMASGLPVIAYDYACAHLHVREHDSGWLAPRGNQFEFIKKVLNLPAMCVLKRAGIQAQKTARHIGWQYPVQQFEQALYELNHAKVFQA